MNLRQIEVFRALMLHGSVTAAARALNVSQPAVTRLIRLLEDRARLQLFARVKGRLVPTREAVLLNEEVGKVYDGIDRVRGVLARLREHGGGYVRILCAQSVAHSLAMERLAVLARNRPDLRLLLDTAPFGGMMEAVLTRRADLGIGMGPGSYPGLASRPVGTAEFVLVVPSGHALARATVCRAADLEGERVITYRPESPLFHVLRETPFGDILEGSAFEVGSSLLACAAVAHGIGIAIAERVVAGSAMFPALACVPLDPVPAIPIRVFFHPEDATSGTLGQVLAALHG